MEPKFSFFSKDLISSPNKEKANSSITSCNQDLISLEDILLSPIFCCSPHFFFFYCCSLPWNHFYFICNPTPHTKTMNQGNLQTEVKESIACAVENTWVKLIGLNTFYVTSFSSILYWSNSEYWSQKQTQSVIIDSI